uniref:Protein transport protein sec31-like n=1 Tax=Ciona intestinalis TaxID=7719 RepID=F6VGA3_CIOIN|nr:protein transport protein sec31-like isoform X1 [Ciona intestinalis]|eukprot:XP_002127534.1 protein transport protein sec31-like isoform X1 [Ciona intestinalis]
MNSQQYIQYQMAVSAGIQGIPAYAPGVTPYLPMANPSLTAGLQGVVPPPPPPVAVSSPEINEIENPSSVTITTTSVAMTEETAEKPAADTIASNDSEKTVDQVELKSPQAALTSTTMTTSAVPNAVVPTPMVLPSTSQPSLIGGVYAGAYIQQAIPQQPAQVPVAQSPYMMAQAGVQYAIPQSSKVMYIPQGYGGVQPSPYVAAGQQPMLVQDHTGKTYILNAPAAHAPLQYQMAQPGLKAPGQQYVVVPNQYYAGAVPTNPAVQQVYGRQAAAAGAATAQSIAPLASYPPGGTVPGAQSPQVFYYY